MDKKKLFGLFLVLVMVLLSLTGCGSKDSTTESSGGSEPASSSGKVSCSLCFRGPTELETGFVPSGRRRILKQLWEKT